MTVNRKGIDLEIKQFIKEKKKAYGFNSRMDILFKVVGDCFVKVRLSGTGIDGNKLTTHVYIKPLMMDDLFWEVFDMEGNKKEPLSLRAVGAFTFDALPVYKTFTIVSDYEEVFPYLDEEIKKINRLIDELIPTFHALDDFYEYSKTIEKPSLYDRDLSFMLLSIYKGEYRQARELAEKNIANHERGRFAQESKYIYDYVVDYCLQRER